MIIAAVEVDPDGTFPILVSLGFFCVSIQIPLLPPCVSYFLVYPIIFEFADFVVFTSVLF
jgi:hypothetical protein